MYESIRKIPTDATLIAADLVYIDQSIAENVYTIFASNGIFGSSYENHFAFDQDTRPNPGWINTQAIPPSPLIIDNRFRSYYIQACSDDWDGIGIRAVRFTYQDR